MTENPYDPNQQPPVPPPPPGQPASPYGQAPGYAPPAGYPEAGSDPAAPYGRDVYGRPFSSKSKVVAGVLQLVLGGVGAGRWYTGHYGMAVAQLLTCGGLGIWALVDGILLLVKNDWADSEGRILHG